MIQATMNKPIEFRGKTYSQRHGGPFDRGAADSYYGRPRRPHYFIGDTYSSERVSVDSGPIYDAYMAGYDFNEQFGDKKQWD